MSVFCKAVVSLLLALPAVAQSQASKAITIQPDPSGDPRNARMQVLPTGDLIASAVPVLTLLRYAYDVPINPSPRLSGLPGWTIRERYNIEAKAPVNTVPPGLPGSEVRGRTQQMVRGLLADRFKLAMRVEHKTMAGYALSVASGGPKLQKSRTVHDRQICPVLNVSGEVVHIYGFCMQRVAQAADKVMATLRV